MSFMSCPDDDSFPDFEPPAISTAAPAVAAPAAGPGLSLAELQALRNAAYARLYDFVDAGDSVGFARALDDFAGTVDAVQAHLNAFFVPFGVAPAPMLGKTLQTV